MQKSNNYPKSKKSFQALWVAGTLGAYFSALIANLTTDIQQFSTSGDFYYTIEVFTPYLFLLWFLVYFFVSNLGNTTSEEVKKWDVLFDVTQSLLALLSAYFLGFSQNNSPEGIFPFFFAMLSIYFICQLSICFFNKDETDDLIKKYRFLGAVISGVASFVLVGICLLMSELGRGSFINFICIISLAPLYFVLIKYSCLRIKMIQ